MKRLTLLVVGLALLGGVAAGCSKSDDAATTVPGANVDANKISNDAAKCTELATTWSSMFTPLASPTFTDADKDKVSKAAEEFKGKVPDKVKADVDVIVKGIKDSKTQTDVAKFLGTKEYTDSFQKVTTYVTTDCAKVGS
jgi:hypothetical protein